METALDLATIRQTLEEQRQNLEAFIDKKQSSQHAMEVSNPGSGDRAMDSRNKNREKLLINHVVHQLEDVKQALPDTKLVLNSGPLLSVVLKSKAPLPLLWFDKLR